MRREAEMQAQVEQLQDALRVARGEAPKHPVFGKVTTNMRCGPGGGAGSGWLLVTRL